MLIEDVLGSLSGGRAYMQIKALGLRRMYRGKVTKAANERQTLGLPF